MTISDINTKISFLTKTNTTSFPAADRLILVNNAYNRISSLILRADSRWQWDDTNQTDLPIATTTLTTSQQDYSLATTHLTIDRVEVKDTAGNWHRLTQIDQQLLKRGESTALAAYQSTTGTPSEYDLVGNSLFLYPAPNYTQAASLKIYFTRGPVEFTSAEVTTGTKVPGFNSLFHDLIPLWVAFDYATANGMPTASGFFASIQRLEQQIADFYGMRNRDERPQLTVSRESNR